MVSLKTMKFNIIILSAFWLCATFVNIIYILKRFLSSFSLGKLFIQMVEFLK